MAMKAVKGTFAVAVLLTATAPGGPVHAVTLTASDPNNTSSFTEGTRWSDFAAPSSLKDYENNAFSLRTPISGNPTFAGNSLTLGATGPSVGLLVTKIGNGAVVTVNDLRLNGGRIAHGNAGQQHSVAGAIMVQAGGGYLSATASGRVLRINASMTGSGDVNIESPSAGGIVSYDAVAKTYTGNTIINSGAILRQGLANALPHGFNGFVDVKTGGTLRLNNFAMTIDGLTGAGTVENGGAGPVTLTVGNTGSGDETFSGVIRDAGGALSFEKTGNDTQTLSGANTYTGATTIGGGTLQVTSAAALGNSGGGTTVNGDGTLRIGDALAPGAGITVGESSITLAGRASATSHIDSQTTGTNAVSGAVSLSGAQNVNITSTTGLLDFNNTVSGDATAQTLNLGGAGDGEIGSLIMGGGADSVVKSGAGTWTIGSGSVETVDVQAGTLVLNNNLADLTSIQVDAGAALDVSALGSFTAPLVSGNGTVDLATTDIASAVALAPGDGSGDIGALTLTATDVLNIDGIIRLDLNGTQSDQVDVQGSLDLSGAHFDFLLGGPLSATHYVLMTYTGSLTGQGGVTADAVAGYILNYDTPNQVRLVQSGDPSPGIPAPTPLALLALGVLGLAGSRMRLR